MDYSLLRIDEFTSLSTEISAIVTTYLIDRWSGSSYTSLVESSGDRRSGQVITITVADLEGQSLGTITTTVQQKSPNFTHMGFQDGFVKLELNRGTVTTRIRLNQEFLAGVWQDARTHYYSKHRGQVPSAQLLQIRTGQDLNNMLVYCRDREAQINGGFANFHRSRRNGNGAHHEMRTFRSADGTRHYSPSSPRVRTYR
ncbi:MAG TPA: hypothetical protein VI912_02550 [Candidatus Bilamarchaeaceae archaeon]|nr:hypothetical protein [Candidatus Bilamarchaeaceae archaeon]